MESVAFVFPLRTGKTQEWRAWIREILGSLSQYVFDGPSADEDEAHSHARKVMERLGMIRP